MSATATPSASETIATAAAAPAPVKPAFDEAAHEATVRAKFDELGGKPNPTLKEEAPFPWEKDNKALAKVEAKTVPAKEKGAEEDANANAPSSATPDPKAPDRDTRERIALAKRALAQRGLHDNDEIEAMPVEKLLLKGEKAARLIEADRKAYAALKGNKLPAGDTTGADTTAAGRSSEPDSTVAQTGQPPADDIDRLIEAGDITTEQGDRIKALHRTANEKVQAATRLVATTRMDAAKAKLVETFPDLATPEGESEVRKWMAKHDPQGSMILGDDVEAFHKYFEDACYVQWGREIGRVTREQMLKGNQTTRNGQPDSSSPRATDPASITPEERRKLVARAAEESNGDEAVFKATLARIGLPANS